MSVMEFTGLIGNDTFFHDKEEHGDLMKNALLCSYTEELLKVFSITYPNWSPVTLEVATGYM